MGLFVACIAAAGVIGATVYAPAYELALYLTITVGLLCSLLAVRSKLRLDFLGIIIIVVAFAAFVVRRVDLFPVYLLYPAEAVGQSELALAVLIAWIMAGFCFMQSRREHMILCLVSGLAIFGLIATVNLDMVVLVSFSIYLFGALYSFGYDNLLAVCRTDEGGWRHVPSRQWSWSQLLPAAVLFLVVTVLATGAGRLMYDLSPNLYGAAGKLSWQWSRLLPAGYQMSGGGFWVGGGPAYLSDEVVMTVKSERPALWRSQLYDTYEGQSWFIRNSMSTTLSQSSDGYYRVPDLDSLRGTPLKQSVTLWTDMSGIVAAAQPATIGLFHPVLGGPHPALLTYRPAGPIYVAPFLPHGSSYDVVSIVPDFSAEQLRAAGTDYLDEEFTELYIGQVPLAAQTKLTALVAGITDEAHTPYDKAMRIKQFLEQDYLYTQLPPVTPRNTDAAVHFLLSTKRGDCSQFATAMAVMCRLAGVPARIATGYGAGEYDPDSDAYVVRGKHAHAWTEVYFPGYGWVPFDAQAPAQLEEQTLASLWHRGHFRLVLAAIIRTGTFVLGGVALVALLAAMFVNFNVLGTWWRARRARRMPWNALDYEWRRFYRRALHELGVRPHPADTPGELLSLALSSQLVATDLAAALHQATDDLYELRYSARPATSSQTDKLRRRWAHLRKRIYPLARRSSLR